MWNVAWETYYQESISILLPELTLPGCPGCLSGQQMKNWPAWGIPLSGAAGFPCGEEPLHLICPGPSQQFLPCIEVTVALCMHGLNNKISRSLPNPQHPCVVVSALHSLGAPFRTLRCCAHAYFCKQLRLHASVCQSYMMQLNRATVANGKQSPYRLLVEKPVHCFPLIW